jgi:hypothetical protein
VVPMLCALAAVNITALMYTGGSALLHTADHSVWLTAWMAPDELGHSHLGRLGADQRPVPRDRAETRAVRTRELMSSRPDRDRH